MTLATLHAVNVATAGTDFEWAMGGGSSRPRSDAFPGLVAWLRVAQGNVCAACGESLTGEIVNVCHLVSTGSRNRGYCAGNLYLGHRECNEIDSERFGAIVPIESLARPELVPTEYPTRGTMLALVSGETTDKDARKARRLAARGL